MAIYPIRIGSFCSGIGGLDLGVKIAIRRSRTVVLCERDSYAAATLVARMEGAAMDQAPVWDRVDTFPAADFHGCLDLLLAGYPCQPFSFAGKRLGAADPRHLWPHIRRIIRESQPGACFLENVAGHLRLGFGPSDPLEEAIRASQTVRQDVRAMGYRVAAGIFTAEEVGPPHERKRLFILAYRPGGGLRKLWESLWCNGLVDGGGEQLRDATGRQEWRKRSGIAGSRQVSHRGSGAELSDTECEPLGTEWLDDPRERPEGGEDHGTVFGEGSAAVPDTEYRASEAGIKSTEAQRQARRAASRRGQADIPDAECARRAQAWFGCDIYPAIEPEEGCRELGHAGGGEHKERRGIDRDSRAEFAATPGTGIPLFPPGRSDRESWSRIRELRPDLWPAIESGVRLLADGVAPMVDEYRVDQLRCIGNAVVPLQAALALTNLVRRAYFSYRNNREVSQ